MTYSDASNVFNAQAIKDQIISGPGSLIDKSRRLANLQALLDKPGEEKHQWTVGDVIHGLIGASIGAGISKGVTSLLPLSDRFKDKLETAAMGVGAAMNTGVIKWAEEDVEAEVDKINKALPKIAAQRRHAFRLGFLKAAKQLGVMEKTALLPIPVVSLGIGDIVNIPRALARAVTSTGGTVGSLAGSVTSPDATEKELTELELDKALLEEQLERLKADKRNRALRKILANRQR